MADPLLDVASSVAEVSADAETGWTLLAVSPGVDGGEWDVEKFGQLLSGEQRFELVHPVIVDDHPFIS